MPKWNHATSRYPARPHALPFKAVCKRCGERIDACHAASKCEKDYHERIDAEAMAKKRGTA